MVRPFTHSAGLSITTTQSNNPTLLIRWAGFGICDFFDAEFGGLFGESSHTDCALSYHSF